MDLSPDLPLQRDLQLPWSGLLASELLKPLPGVVVEKDDINPADAFQVEAAVD